jgi:hypothetical protein
MAYVAAYGQIAPDGSIGSGRVRLLDDAYIPGATAIAVRGVVVDIDRRSGQAVVGALSVDVASFVDALAVGDVIEFSGTQPHSLGLVLVSELRADGSIGSGRAATDGSIGSGRAATDGSIGSGRAATDGSIGSGRAATDGSIGSGRAATDGSIGSG